MRSPFDIFITDTGNDRVLKVDDKLNLIKQWGTKGTGNGRFIHPHAIGVDSKGNVYVGVLNQPGVQVFDSNGTFLTRWSSAGTGLGQFSVPQRSSLSYLFILSMNELHFYDLLII
jgi:hypothetical protein